MNVELFSLLFIYVIFMIFAARRLLTYLHLFQQDDYDGGRFFKWILKTQTFDKKLSAGLLLASVAWYFIPVFISNLIMLGMLAFAIYKERDPRYDSKKKLAMTKRATRIFFVALALCALAPLALLLSTAPWVLLIAVQLVPIMLLVGNGILRPFEMILQNGFAIDAKAKMARMDVKVIGITGSFGKTSVKHILGHILSSSAPTLITPGSVNTPMGITRIIREELQENHRFFVVEMGAYGHGSIERLCKLTPPDIGIITTVGHAHYERFRSLDIVAETKFELAKAVLERQGTIIVGEKTLSFPYAKEIFEANQDDFLVCGKGIENSVSIMNVEQTLNGLEVLVKYKDSSHLLSAPLFGAHHGANMVMAFAAACELGIEPEDAVASLKTVPQISHRLEVKKNQDGNVIIDDAYNSNPVGFQSALDLLTILKTKGRRILITPGMVELGSAHNDIHRQVGAMAASYCDVALIVQADRIPTFVSAFKNQNAGSELITFDTFNDAQKWVNDNVQNGDIILIENDLPDLYERVPKL